MKKLTRENFMKTTGVFVSHTYFDFIQHQYQASKLNEVDFYEKWNIENLPYFCSANDCATFKYMLDDMILSDGIVDNENAMSMQDIIENLSFEIYDNVKKLDKIHSANEELAKQTKDLAKSVKEIKSYVSVAALMAAPTSSILQ